MPNGDPYLQELQHLCGVSREAKSAMAPYLITKPLHRPFRRLTLGPTGEGRWSKTQ